MKRIVVKVGTSTLVYAGGGMNIRHFENLVKVLSDLKNAGNQIVLVSSGAISMGLGKFGFTERPKDMPSRQAAAAVGQCTLMYVYDRMFSDYNQNVAQVLLTGEDLEERKRRINFQNTMNRLLELGALPILNENDTMATAEISSIGDNDTLAAYVARAVKADLLVLLSDIDGLYTNDPHTSENAEMIHVVNEITPEIKASAKGAGTERGTGGMSTKIHAAELCMEKKIDMVILNGAHPELLYDVLDGKEAGTLFHAGKKRK